nr:hypothetical protein [Tanacetum cinerariifolium]
MMTQDSTSVVIEEIVEDNKVKEAAGKEKDGNVVENETQASTSKVAPLFDGCNADDGVMPDSVDEFPAACCETQRKEAEAANGGAESNIHHEEDEIPPTELEVDMNDFHFEVDANIDHVRRQACNMGEDCGVDAIDFDDFNSSEDGGADQIVTNRNKSLKQIRREYKGKCDIREGEFFVSKSLEQERNDKVSVLAIESRRSIKVMNKASMYKVLDRIRPSFFEEALEF